MSMSSKWLKAIIFLLLAITCYAIGGQYGIFTFIILGFFAEGAFWYSLMKKNKAHRKKILNK